MSSIVIAGDTSGSVTLQAPAVAGTTTLTLPSTSGTVLTTASGTAATATNLAGGSNGTIPYQSASGTTQMLAIGTAGQVLQTNGAGAPTWVTASGDIVLVKTASFSGVANTSTTFDNVFTSTYKSYRVVVRQFFGSVTTTLPVMNLRTGGSTNSGSNHNYYYTTVTGAGATAVVAANSSTNWLMPVPWVSLTSSSSWYMDFTGVGASYAEILATFSGLGNGNNSWYTGGVRWEGSATTFDGFIITPTNGVITGTVDVYGYK